MSNQIEKREFSETQKKVLDDFVSNNKIKTKKGRVKARSDLVKSAMS